MKCHHKVTKNACHACTREELSIILNALVRRERTIESLTDTVADLRESLEDATRRMDYQGQRADRLQRAGEALYDAGHWVMGGMGFGPTREHSNLWEALRDAMGREPGSTGRGAIQRRAKNGR